MSEAKIEFEMTDRNIHKFFFHFATAVLLTAAVGCTSESGIVAGPGEGDPVRVGAEVARQINTRGYQESGKVTYGIYYLTYPLNSGESNVANVNFNVEGSTPGVGMVIVPPGKELKWIDVGGSTPTFYLDNVKADYVDAAESTLTDIVFNEDNPFVAGLFDLDQEQPANDLLWGSSMVSHGVKTVNFDLHHYMSRVRVQVSVDRENEKEDGDLDLEGATVSISSLVHKPYSYNRLNGTMSLGESPAYAALNMVEEGVDWAKIEDVDKDGINDIYTTADFVLPPQGLLENELRPVLTITLKNGSTYSGILPHAMEIVDEAHPSGGYPVALYFLKEYILTIRTVITEEPPTLAFMPVKVVEWVDKGDFTIEAHQAGIYTAEEFRKLINYYGTNNEYQLVRYGKLNEETGKWVFDFFHSVMLNYNEINGCMKDRSSGQKDFSFNFNGYSVYILRPGDTEPKETTPGELYRIVNGTV